MPTDGPRRFHGAAHDVVHRAQCDVPVQEVAEQFDDGPIRGMTDQHQREDQLAQPRLGDRKVKENILVLGSGMERLTERLTGGVGLLVEELAADLLVPGQLGNGLSSGEQLDSQILPLLG